MARSIKDLKPNSTPYSQKFHGGYYKVKNPEKYIGDLTKVIYRSSWERQFCIFCDQSNHVHKWASEPYSVMYRSSLDGKQHQYFVDFYMRIENKDGIIEDYLVEVKPKHQTVKPVPPKKNTYAALMKYNEACKTFITNCDKWQAVKALCAQTGKKFILVTEDFLFSNKYKPIKGTISK